MLFVTIDAFRAIDNTGRGGSERFTSVRLTAHIALSVTCNVSVVIIVASPPSPLYSQTPTHPKPTELLIAKIKPRAKLPELVYGREEEDAGLKIR